MAEASDSVFTSELQACFNELKKHSVSCKLGSTSPTAGDEMENPLNKQFSLILSKIEEMLSKHEKGTEDYVKVLAMKASIIYEKAKILLSENFLASSKSFLEDALEVIEEYYENPKVAFLQMRIINHLTYVMSRLGEFDKAKELLEKAIADEDKCDPEVFSTDDLFLNTTKNSKISASKLNRLTLNNMQMLAWIYAKLGDTEENLKMQHHILQKQLDLGEGDVLRWVESCFRLSGLFISQQSWKNARYHLVAAESVLNPLEISLNPNPEIFAIQGDLARSWVYYGLQLFESSRKSASMIDIEPDRLENASAIIDNNDSEGDLLTFSRLQVDMPAVPASNIKNLEEAKTLFAFVQKWIKRGRLYYTLRDFPLQYVNLCLDLSELYRFVSLYEEDLESQYSVQRKRYEALETLSTILKEVRPNCYVAVTIELTKEIIEVQMEMMNLNLKRLYASDNQRPEVNEDNLKKKINVFLGANSQLQKISDTLNSTPTCMKDRGYIQPKNNEKVEYERKNDEEKDNSST
ncbi:hypothetical protein GWI33_007324 [Rhynchophorus ferrugineus]|uniref:KIF-binding protein n=1 Tax=Rhynchophorus ferrugineus TaxID=354439 RepID=A0A834IHZ1_RHYFE|nr:hypothetical protein GWI33_007324 [Rhynchophorus ferrugineus]